MVNFTTLYEMDILRHGHSRTFQTHGGALLHILGNLSLFSSHLDVVLLLILLVAIKTTKQQQRQQPDAHPHSSIQVISNTHTHTHAYQ